VHRLEFATQWRRVDVAFGTGVARRARIIHRKNGGESRITIHQGRE
jgi:hypothetical protein